MAANDQGCILGMDRCFQSRESDEGGCQARQNREADPFAARGERHNGQLPDTDVSGSSLILGSSSVQDHNKPTMAAQTTALPMARGSGDPLFGGTKQVTQFLMQVVIGRYDRSRGDHIGPAVDSTGESSRFANEKYTRGHVPGR